MNPYPHPSCPVRWHVLLMAVLLSAVGPTVFAEDVEDGETVVRIEAVAGLRFEAPRFQVEPGDRVRLVLKNADAMMHNLLIVEPGGRLEVVEAALQLGASGPEREYVPDTSAVLHHTRVLGPGEEQSLTFTAPTEEGVYPYVCSYPGHGFIMYGAMYVGGEMPPLEEDPNVPPSGPIGGDHGGHVLLEPEVARTFMPDSGPASIAVALPSGGGGQAYCWDAGACRLRYAWRGGLIDQMRLFTGKGDDLAEVPGRIYYRAAAFPLRIGEPERVAETRRFRGYRLIDGYPQFHYEVDGVEVRELIQAKADGSGLVRHFEVGSLDRPLYFVVDPDAGAEFAASAGAFVDGVLELDPEQARRFTVTLTERPGHAPLGYWSMNDRVVGNGREPVGGVVGRALRFDGEENEIDTGIGVGDLNGGATLAAWVRMPDPGPGNQTIIGAGSERGGGIALAYHNGEGSGGFRLTNRGGEKADRVHAEADAPTDWTHVAATVSGDRMTLYLDGREAGSEKVAGIRAAEGVLHVGSGGGSHFFRGEIDEARIYDRVLSEEEVRALYEQEKSHLEGAE